MKLHIAQKDPDDWTTGAERATGAQISYIKTMSDEIGIEVDTTDMTKAEAASTIEELQKITGRGQRSSN